MKNLFLSLLVIFVISSCSTTSNTQFNPSQAISVVDAVLPPAITLAITKKPETQKYFVMIADAISIFALNENLTPEALQNIIDTAKIKELETPEARAALTSMVNLYKTFYGDIVSQKLDQKNLKVLLQVIANDIRTGLISGK